MAHSRIRILASLGLLAGLAMSINASAQESLAGCNCSQATLYGDKVLTLLNEGVNKPVKTSVGAGPELVNVGSPLPSTSTPRWTIDFGVNTIRVTFVNMPATYGPFSKFTFNSLDPKLPASCSGVPKISGISTASNKPGFPGAPFVPVTFLAHQVVVTFGLSTGNVDWQPGEYIEVTLQFACDPITPTPTPDPNPTT